MMRVTINKADGYVQIAEDGNLPESYPVDLSSLPSYCQVIQWFGESGHIEFVRDLSGKTMLNQRIVDFGPYEYLVDAWRHAKREAEDSTKRSSAKMREREQAAAQEREKAEAEVRAAAQERQRLLDEAEAEEAKRKQNSATRKAAISK